MAQHDEISSTERLLELIRNKEDTPPESLNVVPPQAFTAGLASSIQKIIPYRKKTVIGVEIGRNELKLASVDHSVENKMMLLDYATVAFSPELSRTSPEFSRFLKTAFFTFCGNVRATDIWCAISSANVETRYIKIPKVPAKQIYNAVYWTFKKEVSFNEKTDLFDFELLGEITDAGVRKLEVICYSAPTQEIQELKNIFERIGYPLTGISIVPFAVQNLLRTHWINPEARNLCNLFVGTDWSRIAVFSEGNLVLSRDIKAGVISMVEAIREALARPAEEDAELPLADGTTPAVEPRGGRLDFENDPAGQLFQKLTEGFSAGSIELNGVTYPKDTVFEMIQPALDRVVRQVERTVDHYNHHYARDDVGKLFVSGTVFTNPEIVDYIGKQLGIPIEVIDPFKTSLSSLENVTIPESEGDKGEFVPALGMALSDNSITPNFIFTNREKQRAARTMMLNRLAFSVLTILLVFCFGVNYWQGHLIRMKKGVESRLQRQVDSAIPYVDQNLLVQMMSQKQQGNRNLNKVAQRFKGAAIIGEIARMTPEHVKLLNLTAELGGVEQMKTTDKKSGDRIGKNFLTLEGVIVGDRLTFESALSNYLVNLKKSPMVNQARIQRQTLEMFENSEALRFTAQLELV